MKAGVEVLGLAVVATAWAVAAESAWRDARGMARAPGQEAVKVRRVRAEGVGLAAREGTMCLEYTMPPE